MPWNPTNQPTNQPINQSFMIYCDVIHQQNMGYHEEERAVTGNVIEGYKKIHAGNIIAWVHLKWGNFGAQSEGCDHGVSKAYVLLGWAHHKVHR